ncbi:MAG TPA: helix-turn-helix domain-containing protein [Terriglobales bacterium]|nr:helix-turn-helix domain-containing protein [Terriglobales bacterium]
MPKSKKSRSKKKTASPRYSKDTLAKLRKKYKIKKWREMQNLAIDKAMQATKGDKLLVAALLGVGKTTIYRRLNTH